MASPSPGPIPTSKQKAQFKELWPKRDVQHAAKWLQKNASKLCRACKASGTKCTMPEGGTATRCVQCGTSKRTPCSKTTLEQKSRIMAAMGLTHSEYDTLDQWYNETVLTPRAEARKEQKRAEKEPSASHVHKNDKNSRPASEPSPSPSIDVKHKRPSSPVNSPERHAKRIKTVDPASESEEEIVTRRRPKKQVVVQVPITTKSKKPREHSDHDQASDHETDPEDSDQDSNVNDTPPAAERSATTPAFAHEHLRSCKPVKQPRKISAKQPSPSTRSESIARRTSIPPQSPLQRRPPQQSARRSPSNQRVTSPPASLESITKDPEQSKTDTGVASPPQSIPAVPQTSISRCFPLSAPVGSTIPSSEEFRRMIHELRRVKRALEDVSSDLRFDRRPTGQCLGDLNGAIDRFHTVLSPHDGI
ncbi:hypothetical protein VNI00_012596 [Paramarasmius palmivorus]|uniref:Zn(2)-C6 fungal-type domain-containing protein n=1 Tax=Paramarasmius palmivorus TaxID=297713 RepID=A0AAW0C5W6_9AGAR